MELYNTLTLQHELSGIHLEEFIGYQCELTIVDTVGSANVQVKPYYALISNTGVRTYQRFSFLANNEVVSSILSIIASAKLEISIFIIGVSGTRYKIISDYKPLSEFKVDTGPSAQTMTVNSDSTVVDFTGGDYNLAVYSRKTHKNDSGGTFSYLINPLNYKYIGLDSVLTEAGNQMRVTSKNLIIKDSSAELDIRAIQI